MEINFEKDMEIDETALDVEWLRQGQLAHAYNKHFANCTRAVQIKHEELKTIRSELILKINKYPEVHLGEGIKLTDPKVEAAWRSNQKYKKVKSELIDLEHEARMAELAKNEINFTRKATLENLVQLHQNQYFAGPSIPRDLHTEVERRKAYDEAVKDNANKRTGNAMKPMKRKKKLRRNK